MREKKSSYFRRIFIGLFILVLVFSGLYLYKYKNNIYTSCETTGKVNVKSEIYNQLESKEFKDTKLINDDRGVPIIGYHSINECKGKKSPIVISPKKFREHMKALKDNGYTTLNLSQLYDYLYQNKPIPEKSVVLTFDDGYKDNYINAYPVLKEFNMNATIFVISSYLDGDVYMLPEQVKELSDAGIDIESHTVNHKRLGDLSYTEQFKEVLDSKERLQKLTGKNINSIAYPEGIYNDDTLKAISKAGYTMAFTIKRGYADRSDNKYELNRICVDYTYSARNLISVLKGLEK